MQTCTGPSNWWDLASLPAWCPATCKYENRDCTGPISTTSACCRYEPILLHKISTSKQKIKDFTLFFDLAKPWLSILHLSLSQTQPQPAHFYYVCFIFYVYFTYAVSLIKAINSYCNFQLDWILFHSRNIHLSNFGWGWTRDFQRCLTQPQPKHLCVYFLNKVISSQIVSCTR